MHSLNIATYHKDYDDFPIFTIRKTKLKPFIFLFVIDYVDILDIHFDR